MRVSLNLSRSKTFAIKSLMPAQKDTPALCQDFKSGQNKTIDNSYKDFQINFTSRQRIGREKFPLANPHFGLSCPGCGDKMQPFNKTKARLLASKIAPKRGEELQKILIEHREDFQASKRELVDEIISIIPKYPERNFSELLEVLAEKKYINKLRTKQLLVTSFLWNEILNIKPENMPDMVEWQQEQVMRIMEASDEGQFRNKFLISSFINYAHQKGIEIDENRVRAYFGRLPNSKKDVEAFVVKYMRRTPREAAFRLIKNVEPTIEHIKPFAKSKNNSSDNLLVMCSDCNTARGDMSYEDYIKQHPEMKQNIKKYFKDVESLNERKISGFDCSEYVQKVKETLQNYSPNAFSFLTNSGIL